MFDRKTLLARLSDVEAALGPASGPFPNRALFWFTGKALLAFNGKIALSVALSTEFTGGVPRKLVALLKTSGANDVDLYEEKDDLIIKSGGKASKQKLPMMPMVDLEFSMPKEAALALSFGAMPVDAGRFMQTMECCLRSCGAITHTIDLLGVTVINEGKKLLLFSTDAETVSHGEVDLRGDLPFKRTILPTDFCKQFVKIAAGAEKLFAHITPDYAVLDHDGVTLYGATIEPDARPLAFKAVVYSTFTQKVEDQMVKIPPEIIAALERAAIITTKAKDNPRTTVDVKNSMAKIYAHSEQGEAQDATALSGRSDAHPDVVAIVNAKRMLEGCLNFEKMAITRDAVIFTRDRLVFMVSGTV